MARWARFAAFMIDAVALYWVLRAIEALLLASGIYIPFEATYLVVFIAGRFILLATTGTTPGRWLCGATIAVRTRTGESAGFGRRAVRQVARLLAVVPLAAYVAARIAIPGMQQSWMLWPGRILLVASLAFLAVFAWMGLHDRVAGTTTVRKSGWSGARLATTVGLALPIVLLGWWAIPNLLFYLDARKVVPEKMAEVRFAGRDSSLVADAATIDSATGDGKFVAWLDSNAVPPADFAVAQCRKYPVVLLGESHGSADILSFVATTLPRLYREAGVRVLGMESINAEENGILERLMAGATFDEAVAVDIYRRHSWHTWGQRGYVDVLRAAWLINRDRAPDDPPFRVVGIDEPLDLPSLALAGIGDDRVPAPFVERLRVGRVLRDMPKLTLRDVYMARHVEREMIEAGERGVVLVGANHTSIGALAPWYGPQGDPRMGFILRSKYADRVFQIGFVPWGIGEFVDRVMAKRGYAPAGFALAGSPFDLIRRSDAGEYRGSPAIAFGDLAASYIHLVPRDGRQESPWMPGYVTPAMFARYRPLYAARWGDLRGPADIDSVMSIATR